MTVIIRYYNVCVRVLQKQKNILPQNGTGDLRPSSMDGPSSNIAGHSQIIIQIFHF